MSRINFFFATIILVASLGLSSCKDNNDALLDQNGQRMNSPKPDEKDLDQYWLKKEFAIALHKAMCNSVEVRKFIKDEALKKFDYDYDVLYNLVKDDFVEKTGKTFRELLLQHFESEEKLLEIERKIPLLTIFVPTLPEESFSAENWDIENDVPIIAIRMLYSDEIPMISSNPEESGYYPPEAIPGFPVLVLKENERVIWQGDANFENIEGKIISNASNTCLVKLVKYSLPLTDYHFPDYCVQCLEHETEEYKNYVGERLIKAWEEFGMSQDYWQRDYIHYGLNINQDVGPFSPRYKESITTFKLQDDGQKALYSIAKIYPGGYSQDPQLRPNIYPSNNITNVYASSFWTDGFFEFMFYANRKAEETKGHPITLRPDELFNITYESYYYDWWDKLRKKPSYRITSITTKEVPTLISFSAWNMQVYATSWNVYVEEVDAQGKTTINESYSTKFAVNFGYDVGLGETVKIGLKYGQSQETTQTSSSAVETTIVSDQLGMTDDIYVGDPVIREEYYSNGNKRYRFTKYSPSVDASYTVTFRPVSDEYIQSVIQ